MWIISQLCLFAFVNAHEPEYVDINEMFPSFHDPEPEAFPYAMAQNVTINIEKLDFVKYRKKMADDLREKMQQEDRDLKQKARNGRRARIVYWNNLLIPYINASRHIVRHKTVDLMLQLIYMSRQKIQQIEQDKSYQAQDSGYRMGFLYNKMSNIVSTMINMLSHLHQLDKSYQKPMKLWPGNHVLLHAKIVRLHVDFTYLYWVLQNLDGTYRSARGDKVKPKLPKSYHEAGGISQEKIYDKYRVWD